MAEKHHITTSADGIPAGGIDFRNWPSDSIVQHIDNLSDEIDEHSSQIAAIAYGGREYAGRLDSSGNKTESICEGMFGAIVSMSESAILYLQLKSAIAELSGRLNAAPSNKESK